MHKRIFWIVLDSLGIGEAPDADAFGDAGSNTLAAISKSSRFFIPNLARLGIFNIDKVTAGEKAPAPAGAFARLQEKSQGKDTTIGHWEMAGVISGRPMPVFPHGFPPELIDMFKAKTGRGVLCNKPYSGTQVIQDYGAQHMATGALIVYTSADSVFQIAANEDVVPLAELYGYCEMAREMLQGDWAVGRVIARPFVGNSPQNFRRTANRHDYSLPPPAPTVLDDAKDAGLDVIGVGKIGDIFAMRGITESLRSASNKEGMEITLELARRDFGGICFVNLVEFDMVFGHRNDVDGYANALSEFDLQLGRLLPLLRPDDLLMITADHGCDPSTASTDHSREDVPLLLCGSGVVPGTNAGTQSSFTHAAASAAHFLGLPQRYYGKSLLQK